MEQEDDLGRLSYYMLSRTRTIQEDGVRSEVFEAKCKDRTDLCVVKVSDVSRHSERQAVRIRREALLLTDPSLRHPNLMHALETFCHGPLQVVVMPCATGGDLLDMLNDWQGFLEHEARIIAAHILSGLKHLHSRGYIHADVKLENIVVFGDAYSQDVSRMRFVIADWGFVVHESVVVTGHVMGTPEYMAPELFHKSQPRCRVSVASDLWGVGVIVYALLCGNLPFGDDKDMVKLLERITHGRYRPPRSCRTGALVTPMAARFIAKLLAPDPVARGTASSALAQEWICCTES